MGYLVIGIGFVQIGLALLRPEALIAYPGRTEQRRVSGLVCGTAIVIVGVVLTATGAI